MFFLDLYGYWDFLFKTVKTSKSFKLYISPYKLFFKNKIHPPVEGSLLAFDFGFYGTGYSDFLPWPSFKEQNLFKQLQQLKKGIFSQRFLIAKKNALLDAQARSQKRNLFFGLKIPSSHYLITDLLSFNNIKDLTESPFQTVKVKLKAYKIPEQIKKIKTLCCDFKNIKWRLDLNGQSFHPWKKLFNFLKEDLDFIEDPLEKTFLKKEEKKLFAEDWRVSPHFQIKIIKPSRDSLKDILKGVASSRWKRLIFTHSLDQPLGQVTTAFWAGSFYKSQPSFFETGAFTHSLFKVDSYPLSQGPEFIPPNGYGFGFTDSLKKEKWKRWL